MRKYEFRLGKHVYQRFVRLAGPDIYFKDGYSIDPYEYETAQALLGVNMKPTLPQTEEDLLWAIQHHVKPVWKQ